MDPKDAAALWADVVDGELGGLDPQDQRLARHLALEVLTRWQDQAIHNLPEDAAEGALDVAFKTFYVQNKEGAQRAIVAIVELVKCLGATGQLPEQYRGVIN